MGQREVQSVDGPRQKRNAAGTQGLSLIPHLTSVAATLYRSGVINGSQDLGRPGSCDDAVHRLVS